MICFKHYSSYIIYNDAFRILIGVRELNLRFYTRITSPVFLSLSSPKELKNVYFYISV